MASLARAAMLGAAKKHGVTPPAASGPPVFDLTPDTDNFLSISGADSSPTSLRSRSSSTYSRGSGHAPYYKKLSELVARRRTASLLDPATVISSQEPEHPTTPLHLADIVSRARSVSLLPIMHARRRTASLRHPEAPVMDRFEEIKKELEIVAEREGIITTVETVEEAEAIPLWQQGDWNMYTSENMQLRESLGSSAKIAAVTAKWWAVATRRGVRSGVDRAEYVHMNKLMYKALIPVYNAREAERVAQDDWLVDCDGRKELDNLLFCNSLFELADIWTLTTEEHEYVEFLNRLLHQISDGDHWRDLNDVDCLDLDLGDDIASSSDLSENSAPRDLTPLAPVVIPTKALTTKPIQRKRPNLTVKIAGGRPPRPLRQVPNTKVSQRYGPTKETLAPPSMPIIGPVEDIPKKKSRRRRRKAMKHKSTETAVRDLLKEFSVCLSGGGHVIETVILQRVAMISSGQSIAAAAVLVVQLAKAGTIPMSVVHKHLGTDVNLDKLVQILQTEMKYAPEDIVDEALDAPDSDMDVSDLSELDSLSDIDLSVTKTLSPPTTRKHMIGSLVAPPVVPSLPLHDLQVVLSDEANVKTLSDTQRSIRSVTTGRRPMSASARLAGAAPFSNDGGLAVTVSQIAENSDQSLLASGRKFGRPIRPQSAPAARRPLPNVPAVFLTPRAMGVAPACAPRLVSDETLMVMANTMKPSIRRAVRLTTQTTLQDMKLEPASSQAVPFGDTNAAIRLAPAELHTRALRFQTAPPPTPLPVTPEAISIVSSPRLSGPQPIPKPPATLQPSHYARRSLSVRSAKPVAEESHPIARGLPISPQKVRPRPLSARTTIVIAKHGTSLQQRPLSARSWHGTHIKEAPDEWHDQPPPLRREPLLAYSTRVAGVNNGPKPPPPLRRELGADVPFETSSPRRPMSARAVRFGATGHTSPVHHRRPVSARARLGGSISSKSAQPEDSDTVTLTFDVYENLLQQEVRAKTMLVRPCSAQPHRPILLQSRRALMRPASAPYTRSGSSPPTSIPATAIPVTAVPVRYVLNTRPPPAGGDYRSAGPVNTHRFNDENITPGSFRDAASEKKSFSVKDTMQFLRHLVPKRTVDVSPRISDIPSVLTAAMGTASREMQLIAARVKQ
eukprot:TRINITY_DN782_c0_g1_i1.p1 TRINITY_DN782_c0_g1~~TRINITY_DN782_c0_g1_i1.p1  ORF type:complete len:1298 (+),score=213.59 TRINITY_DN782_c0_g1_i1:513-3896(+)